MINEDLSPKSEASLEGLTSTQEDASLNQSQPQQEQPTIPSLVQDASVSLDEQLEPLQKKPLQKDPAQKEPLSEESTTDELTDTPEVKTPKSNPEAVMQATTLNQSRDNKTVEDSANLNTPADIIEKYTSSNRTKASLIAEAEDNPAAMELMVSAGLINSKDLQNIRYTKLASESKAKLDNLNSAVFKDTDTPIGWAGNTVMQFITGGVNSALAYPDAALTLGTTLLQDPVTKTDTDYQVYLLGRERLQELAGIINDKSTSTDALAEAHAEVEALQPAVETLRDDVRGRSDYEDTHNKYISDYYADNATNFISKMRDGISGLANNENVSELSSTLGEILDDNLGSLATAKQSFEEGNLLRATGQLFAGLGGLSVDAVEAMVRNPAAVIDVLSNSMGMMAVGKGTGIAAKKIASKITSSAKALSVADKIGHLSMYQSMIAADAYKTFEDAYGHLPEADQLVMLNGMSAVAALTSLIGDGYMMNSLSKIALRPKQIKNTAIKDVLSTVPTQRLTGAMIGAGRAVGSIATSRTAAGAATETVQEFVEGLITQYAGIQDLDKIDLKDATVQALMATGAGALTGSVGDIGSAYRNVGKGTLQKRTEQAREGFNLNRNEITDLDSAKGVITDTVKQLNTVDASLEKDEAGNIVQNQENAIKVSDLYDTTLSNLAGLDSLLAGVPALEHSSIRQSVEESIRKGESFNSVIDENVDVLKAFTDTATVAQQLASNPALQERLKDPATTDAAKQEIINKSQQIATIAKQVLTNASQLTSNYDLDALVKEADGTRKISIKAARAKIKANKKAKAEEVEGEQAKADTKETKAKSKFTVSEILADVDSNLSRKEQAETTVDNEEYVEPELSSDVSSEIEAESKGNSQSDAALNSPTNAQVHQSLYKGINTKESIPLAQGDNLGKFNNGMAELYSRVGTDKKAAETFVSSIGSLIKELDTLSKQDTLSDSDKAKARALALGVASYTTAYKDAKGASNKDLGALLNTKKLPVNLTALQKTLRAKKVDLKDVPQIYGHIKSAANTTADGKVAPKSTKSTTSIDSPSESVTSTKRLGVHTTERLDTLGVRDAFSTLNTLMTSILSDKVDNLPTEFVEDVVAKLTEDTVAFDSIYTALTGTNKDFTSARKARFTDQDLVASTQAEAVNSYKALAEYFTRVDPEHRDLTHVLSKYIPEVHAAIDTMLADADIPSEFNATLNAKVRELVFEPKETNVGKLPTTVSEQTVEIVDGLSALQVSDQAIKDSFITSLVEEGLSPEGNTVKILGHFLASTDEVSSLPTALVNKTMLARINTFINANSLPNTVKDVDTATDALWKSNVYNGVAEAFSRLNLGSSALNNLSLTTSQTGAMYQVFNVLSVLEDTSNENYEKVVASFTPTELAELQAILPIVQQMRNINAHLHTTAMSGLMQNNRALDLFESMNSGSSANSDNYMHPNLSAIIAQTALEYSVADGVQALGYNNAESIESLVGKDLARVTKLADALSSGSMVTSIAPRLGKAIRKRLGLVAKSDQSTSDELAQMDNSLGHMALALLDNAGIIKGETVAMSTDSSGNRHVGVQDGFGSYEAPKGHTLEPSNIYRIYKYNEEHLNSHNNEETGATFYNKFGLSKTTAQKLYGVEDKPDVATDSKDIKVRGDSSLADIARENSTKSPEYKHDTKYAIFANLSPQAQEELFGGNIDTSKVHEDRKKTAEAKNNKAKADVARIHYTMDTLEAEGKDNFYLHQIVGNNKRFVGNNPKGADPVNMTAARYLFSTEPQTDITFGSTNPEDIAKENMFYKGMVFALDLGKPEEMTAEQAKEVFESLASNADLQEATTIVHKAKTEQLTAEESSRLSTLLGKSILGGEGGYHALDAAFTYSNYLEAKTDSGAFTFDGTMFFEIDGKNNGSALGITQNAPLFDLADTRQMASSTGLNYSDGSYSFAELKQGNPNFLDAYQHLVVKAGEVGNELLSQELTIKEVTELLGPSFRHDDNNPLTLDTIASTYPLVMRLLTGKYGVSESPSLLDAQNNVTKEGRDLFKQVLMTVLYGAGVASQDAYFAKTIESNHLDQMEEFANTDLTSMSESEYGEFVTNLNNYMSLLKSVGVTKTYPNPMDNTKTWNKKLLTSEYGLTDKDAAGLYKVVATTVGLTYRKALQAPTYKTIINQAKSLVESSNVNHLRLHFAVTTLLSKFKATKGIPSNQELTIAQEKEFASTYLDQLITKLSYPLGSTNDTQLNGVSVTSKTNARQHIPKSAFESAEAAMDKARKEAESKGEKFVGSKEQYLPEPYKSQMVRDVTARGNVTFMVSQVFKDILKSPAQSLPPSGIHAVDSSIQAYIAQNGNTPFLNIFDAQGGSITSMVGMDGKGNEAFANVTGSYNLYGDAANSFAKADAALSQLLSPEELSVIDNELANALGLPEFDYTEYMSQIKYTYRAIEARAQDMHKAIGSIDQFPMTENSPFTKTPEMTLEEVREKHQDTIDVDNLPSILGQGEVIQSASHLLGVTEAMEGSTEIVREAIAEGNDLYHLHRSTVGTMFNGTLHNFNRSLSNFSEVASNSKARKRLVDLAKEVNKLLKEKTVLGSVTLPTTFDVNNMDVEVANFLVRNGLSEQGTKTLNMVQTRQLLKNSDPQKVDSTMYTNNSVLNLWLSYVDNSKWLETPVSKLLSEEFFSTFQGRQVLGTSLTPSGVIKALITSPTSRSYIGKEVNGKAPNAIAQDLTTYVNNLTDAQFNTLLMKSKVWGNLRENTVRSVTSLNEALLHSIVSNEDNSLPSYYINNRDLLLSNKRDASAYIRSLTSKVNKVYKKLGAYESGNLTPVITANRVKTKLLSREQMKDAGIELDSVPMSSDPTTFDMDYTDAGNTEINYLGYGFELTGKTFVNQTSDSLEVFWSKPKQVNVDHIYEATGGQLEGTKTSPTSAKIKPVLGSPTYNGETNHSGYNDIAEDALVDTFDSITHESAVVDSPKHTTHLRTLVESISQGLSGVKVKLREVTNGPTRGYFMDNTVHVSINKLLPQSVTNFMSSSEAMAHELVHAITRNVAAISPKLAARARELHAQAKDLITWEDLVDPTLHPDDAESVAKRLYNYMFVENMQEDVFTTVITKQEIKRHSSQQVAEFMALVTTNENVARALNDKIPTKQTHKGFTAKVINLFNTILNTFYRKTNTGLQDASITEEMNNLVFTVAKMQNNHKSTLGKATAKMSEATRIALDSSDTYIKQFVNDVGKWSMKQPSLGDGAWTSPRAYAAAAVKPIVFFMRYDEFKSRLQPMLNRISLFKSRTMGDLVTELTENTPTMHRMHDLIATRTKVIDATRAKTEDEITSAVNTQLFRNPLSDTVATSMTKVLLETDFNKLVEVFGPDKAIDILHMDNKRLHSLRKQYQAKLKDAKYGNYYINHSKALGEFMVNGSSAFYGVHTNAHSIANLAGENKTPESNVEEITESVDVLSSLYAVMNTHPSDRMRVRNFLIKENQEVEAADRNAGVLSVLGIQKSYADEALDKNFYSNPQLVRKGYVRETYNPNIEMIIADTSEVSGFEKQGFEVVGDIPSGLANNDSNKVMMVNRYSAKLNYDQGAFSHTGFNKKGTTALIGEDSVDFDTLVTTNGGAKRMRDATNSMFTDNPVRVDPNNPIGIAPTRNDDGNIKGYRYTMRSKTKDMVLERENRIGHVLARTASSVEDKANSQVHNLNVLEEVYDIYDEGSKDLGDFVTIGPDNGNGDTKPEYAEMWAMLPSYTRAKIAQMNLARGLPENQLIVPKRLLTLLFGAAPMTLAKLDNSTKHTVKYGIHAITALLRTKYGRMASSLYKESLGNSKDTMVIKNVTTTVGNMVSNYFALSIAGVPQSTIIKKTIQGWKEILQYNGLVQEIKKLNIRLMGTQLNSDEISAIQTRVKELEARVSALSVTQLVDEGLYQTIIEEVDTEVGQQLYKSETSKVGDKLLSMTGPAEKALKEGVFLTHDSTTYRYLRDAAQLSDFVSRYAMFEHMRSEGKSVQEAVHEARETFILYDVPLSKPLKALNDLGFFNFAKFLLRTQGILHKNIKRSPARTILYSALWAGLGASATMDVLMTPFNFAELVLRRAQLNPLGFISNGMTELPIIKLLG